MMHYQKRYTQGHYQQWFDLPRKTVINILNHSQVSELLEGKIVNHLDTEYRVRELANKRRKIFIEVMGNE